MTVHWLEAGHCRAPERVTRRDGRWRIGRFPAGFALIRGAGRTVLFDTGYAPRHVAVTRASVPRRLLARVLAPVPAPSAADRLAACGVRAADVTDVVVSHFHTDHVGGLHDFPAARFHAHPDALRPVRAPRGFDERAGYAGELLPDDFDARWRPLAARVPLPAALAPFAAGYDVFGDGTLHALDLPGHAPGQVGLYLDTDAGPWLLAADAAWHVDALFDPRAAPARLGLRIQHDAAAYRATQARLRALLGRHPGLTVAVSHDAPRRTGR